MLNAANIYLFGIIFTKCKYICIQVFYYDFKKGKKNLNRPIISRAMIKNSGAKIIHTKCKYIYVHIKVFCRNMSKFFFGSSQLFCMNQDHATSHMFANTQEMHPQRGCIKSANLLRCLRTRCLRLVMRQLVSALVSIPLLVFIDIKKKFKYRY